MTEASQTGSEQRPLKLRPLCEKDFEEVVAIDRKIIGRSRRGYLEKRLRAALEHPKGHLQLAAEDDRGLLGFVLARVVEGEFGRPEQAVMLEAVGVAPERQRGGVGRSLMEGLEDLMRRKNIREIMTQAEWTNHALLGFLNGMGYGLAPRQIVECSVGQADRL